MKKLTAALLLSAIAVPAFSADEGYYAGLNAGRSKTDSNIGATALTKTNDTSYGVLLGYQLNKNLAFEAQYTDLGNFEATPASGKDEVLALSLVGIMPVADAFSLYAKLGYANTRTSLSNTVAPVSGTNRSDVTYGVGAEFDVAPAIGLRLGWDQYGAAIHDGAGNTQNFKISNWNLGAIFKF
jgi:OOP family OmpA-OmpF porin